MSCTVSYTQLNLTALEQAIADGVLEVQYDDKRVRYRTLSEMERILFKMRTALCDNNVEGKVSGRFGKIFACTDKKLG